MAKKRKLQPKMIPITVVRMTKKGLREIGIDDEPPGWYIDDPNNSCCPIVGPYDTKAEATEGRIGLQKFWRENKWLTKTQSTN